VDADILAVALPCSGAAALGAVSAMLVVSRLVREWPGGTAAQLWLGLWAAALAAGVVVATAGLAGEVALLWLGAGAASSGLVRMAWQHAARPPLNRN